MKHIYVRDKIVFRKWFTTAGIYMSCGRSICHRQCLDPDVCNFIRDVCINSRPLITISFSLYCVSIKLFNHFFITESQYTTCGMKDVSWEWENIMRIYYHLESDTKNFTKHKKSVLFWSTTFVGTTFFARLMIRKLWGWNYRFIVQ